MAKEKQEGAGPKALPYLRTLAGVLILLGVSLLVPAFAQPYTAQIQRALNAFLTQTHTWTAAQTFSGGSATTGNTSTTGVFLAGDGTVAAPAHSFTSEPDNGWYRPAANSIAYGSNGTTAAMTITSAGQVTTVGGGDFTTQGGVNIGGAQKYGFTTTGSLATSANGVFLLRLNDTSIGVSLKADALPTIGSGFGTSPSVTAGSTALAGSVNVGTGGIATTGVITFNGTAFPSAPFCVADSGTSNTATRISTSTTQLTLSTTVAWLTGDLLSWICISSK